MAETTLYCKPIIFQLKLIKLKIQKKENKSKQEKRKCGIFIQWNIIQPYNIMKTCHLWQHEWTLRAK